ncbi:hypothetical protein PFISCL1PPCAC_18473, partial [Pristionchus fissidentatus]
NSEVLRSMKHQIVAVCSEDQHCAACTKPCSESFSDISSCTLKFCSKNEGEAKQSCEESCRFLHKIYEEKPGQCPAFDEISTVYECTAACHLDGDCGETSKCCSVGCSRKCLQPETTTLNLLPVPTGISVTERKRKRSAMIRWNMKKMKSVQSRSLSNLYVIQWRWGIHEESMGSWQTILIKNKPFAILKHLLSPGRLYQFKVAAVSIDGSLGFSAPSEPFKLSKEPRAPNAPAVILGPSRLSMYNLWSQTVQWTPPASDLPIKNYEISWEESTLEEANSFEGRTMAALKRSLEDDDESIVDSFSFGGFGGRKLKKSTIVPSHHNSYFIEELQPNSVYMVEVHATVDSSEGELHGEKGLVFISTSSLSVPDSTQETPQIKERTESTGSLQVQTPYMEKNKLVTSVKWIDTNICTRRGSYVLRLKKESCGGAKSDSQWEERLLSSCSTIVDGLEHDCNYSIQVHTQDERAKLKFKQYN